MLSGGWSEGRHELGSGLMPLCTPQFRRTSGTPTRRRARTFQPNATGTGRTPAMTCRRRARAARAGHQIGRGIAGTTSQLERGRREAAKRLRASPCGSHERESDRKNSARAGGQGRESRTELVRGLDERHRRRTRVDRQIWATVPGQKCRVTQERIRAEDSPAPTPCSRQTGKSDPKRSHLPIRITYPR